LSPKTWLKLRRGLKENFFPFAWFQRSNLNSEEDWKSRGIELGKGPVKLLKLRRGLKVYYKQNYLLL